MGLLDITDTESEVLRLQEVELTTRANSAKILANINLRRGGSGPCSGDVPEALKCVVCLEAERAIILLNCGHVCACVDCAEKLVINYNRCPVCRADIMGALPAYVS